MSDKWINKAEQELSDYAKQFAPVGSSEKAVIHQWLHSIAFGYDLFAKNKGADKTKVIRKLKKEKLYESKSQFLNEITRSINLKSKSKKSFKFIDLFAGIGGMRIGFERNGGQCVFSSEFEKNAQATYEENYGEFPFGDITKISEKDIPDHDVLIGGFPCQAFSHAGLKLGIEDTRGTLFHDIARIIQEKEPKVVLLENVKGLISHDKGNTLKIILKTLTKVGYECIISDEVIQSDSANSLRSAAKEMVLKSCEFGVPQNRQRIYIVLWKKNLGIKFRYPSGTGEETYVGKILEENPDPKYTISDKLWEGHQRRKRVNKINGKGFGYGLVKDDSPYTNTISARYYKDGSEILIYQQDKNPRKLTPKEAAALQGFPDDFIINKSNVQAYKQFGNSVSVPVIKELANAIKTQIL